MSKKDDRAISIAKESCVVVDGHYQVWLPWKDDVVKLSNNYSLAEQRLRKQGNRLIRDPETHKKYKEKIAQMIDDGHAVENNDDSDCASKPDYFALHHCTRPPAKFRVVFDCSARHAGTSLNDHCSRALIWSTVC